MAGIYIHIPFCRQACHYCNFHFSTDLKRMPDLTDAVCREIEIKQDFFRNPDGENPVIRTVYFGGGTPSLAVPDGLPRIMDSIRDHFRIDAAAEITVEANPDDLSGETLEALQSMGVNRLSVGVQSFDDKLLHYMNRAHTGRQAREALDRVFRAGIESVNTDAIYGLPGLGDRAWEATLQVMTEYPVDHISAYALTVERKTALDHFIRKKGWDAPDEERTAAQFLLGSELLRDRGFEHYEVSNFAKPGRRSRHNTSYWSGTPYLGLGPSAHSFRGKERSWNVSNNANYIRALTEGTAFSASEHLSAADQYHEYVMTGLRRTEGIDLDHIRSAFGPPYAEAAEAGLRPVPSGQYRADGPKIRLTTKGWLHADGIAAGMFI